MAVYVSYRNARREGPIATVWVRWEYPSQEMLMGYFAAKSAVSRTEYDCNRVASRSVTLSGYTENNLSGKSESWTSQGSPEWTLSIPGTLDEAVATAACARTKPHAPKPKPKLQP